MSQNIFSSILCNATPMAAAHISGGFQYPDIEGEVKFYSVPYEGVLIEVQIFNLPQSKEHAPDFFGFHIHEVGDCSNGFKNTGNHYNPDEQPHPKHAGDLIPILSTDGYCWMCFYDNVLTLPEILGKSVIIHSKPDDFTSQPSGNSGDKIACGVIKLCVVF